MTTPSLIAYPTPSAYHADPDPARTLALRMAELLKPITAMAPKPTTIPDCCDYRVSAMPNDLSEAAFEVAVENAWEVVSAMADRPTPLGKKYAALLHVAALMVFEDADDLQIEGRECPKVAGFVEAMRDATLAVR